MLIDGWRTSRLIHAALATSHWPPQRLRQLQENGLRKLLVHAYRNVPLYRALYDEMGFRPEEFRSLDDLDKIPILEKRRLKAACPEEVVARGVNPARCETVQTSGSTGTPLRIYLGPRDRQWQRAVDWRILFEHGYRWTDRTLHFDVTPRQRFFVQRLGIARKEWVSFLDSPGSWARRVGETRHEVIVADAGILHALAEAIEALGLEPPRPRIVISEGETLAPATRRLVRRALRSDPVDVYGLVELSNFAWQCEHRRGYHVSADSHIVEVAGPPGDVGSVIATALGMWTMPIIRYDTGDLAEVDSTPCLCGRTFPLLRRIYGRAVDSVILPGGGRLFWLFFHEVLGGYTELRQWRILQEDLHRLRLQLVAPGHNVDLFARIEADLRRALPDEIELSMEPVDTISTTPGVKTRMIISKFTAAAEEQAGLRSRKSGKLGDLAIQKAPQSGQLDWHSRTERRP